MEKYKVIDILNEIFKEVNSNCNNIDYGSFRDGGSVAFTIPTKPYHSIILLAPVHQVSDVVSGKTIRWEIPAIKILKPGCYRFEDSYYDRNILKTFQSEDLLNDTKRKEIIRYIIEKCKEVENK